MKASSAKAKKWIEDNHKHCRGAANHNRVAEGTRPSPKGVYSGVAGLRTISLKNTMNTAGFRVVRAAGA